MTKDHTITIHSDGILVDGIFHTFRWLGKQLYRLSEEDESIAGAIEETLKGIDDCLKEDAMALSEMVS